MAVVINGTTGVSGVDGSAGTPSYQGTDSNTGIFFPAADTIAFGEGGAEAMRIDSSGNVLVNSTGASGAGKFHINAANGTSVNEYSGLTISNTDDQTKAVRIAYNTANDVGVIAASDIGDAWKSLALNPDGGNVGVGTSSPQTKLSAVGEISAQHSANDSILKFGNNGTLSTISATYGSTGAYTPIRFLTSDIERMRIDSSGNVGIGVTSITNKLNSATSSANTFDFAQGTLNGGTNAPLVQFEVSNGNTSITGATAGIVISAGGSGTAQYGLFVERTGATTGNFIIRSRNSNEVMRITSGGEVYIAGTTDQGAYNLQCNGTGVWGAGAYVNGSDARIKEDVAPIESGLDVVTKLNPVTYRYKEDWSKDQSTQTGFIAQELLVALEGQNYVDGVVQQGGSEGYYSVAYQNIIPILTKAIQELKAITDAQTTRIEALEAEVAALKGAN